MFEDVEIVFNKVKPEKAPCVVSLRKLGKAAKPAKASLVVAFQMDALSGFGEGDRLKLQLGKNEHHGIIRLKRHAESNAQLIKRDYKYGGQSQLSLQLGHRPEFVDRREEPKAADFKIIDADTIEITLPKWAQETSPFYAAEREKQERINRAYAAETDRIKQEKAEADARRKRLGMA
jgi:hypothetical protein